MKTPSEILTTVYKIVKQSELGILLKGNVFKRKRPKGVKGCYVVVDDLSSTAGHFQRFEVNVNLYIPDVLAGGEYFPDEAKIDTFSRECAGLFEHLDTSEYTIKYADAGSIRVYELSETHEHCINNLIHITAKNF